MNQTNSVNKWTRSIAQWILTQGAFLELSPSFVTESESQAFSHKQESTSSLHFSLQRSPGRQNGKDLLYVDVDDYANTYIWQIKEQKKQTIKTNSSSKWDDPIHFSEVLEVQRKPW